MSETKRPVGRPPNPKIARLMRQRKCSRATAYRIAGKGRLRAQSTHSAEERVLVEDSTAKQRGEHG